MVVNGGGKGGRVVGNAMNVPCPSSQKWNGGKGKGSPPSPSPITNEFGGEWGEMNGGSSRSGLNDWGFGSDWTD